MGRDATETSLPVRAGAGLLCHNVPQLKLKVWRDPYTYSKENKKSNLAKENFPQARCSHNPFKAESSEAACSVCTLSVPVHSDKMLICTTCDYFYKPLQNGACKKGMFFKNINGKSFFLYFPHQKFLCVFLYPLVCSVKNGDGCMKPNIISVPKSISPYTP